MLGPDSPQPPKGSPMAEAWPVCLLWGWLSLCLVPSAEPVTETLWVFLAPGVAGDGLSSPCALSSALPRMLVMINVAKPCITFALAPWTITAAKTGD